MTDIGSQTYTCQYPDGCVKTLTYTEIKKHNVAIIEDNVMYGYIHPETYSDQEVEAYERKAKAENRSFLAFLREHPDITITLNLKTEMYAAQPMAVVL